MGAAASEALRRRRGRWWSRPASRFFPISFLLLAAVACSANAEENECFQGLSVVSPEVAVPGKSTAILVTVHRASVSSQDSSVTEPWAPTNLPVNATVRLLLPPPTSSAERFRSHKMQQNQVLAEVTREIYGNGIITLPIPADAHPGQWCILHVHADCGAEVSKKGTNCTLESFSKLRLVGRVRDVIVRPAKNYYKPGETIVFWVLALDYDLRVPTNVLGRVTVQDPIGNSVTVWEEVPLDEGVKTFSLPLSHAAKIGQWAIQVDVGEPADVFSAGINVTLEDNAGETPEIAMAEEHFVELRFGPEMRRLYKPGLPFVGKVEAVSTENSVRVRVKVYDNTTAIYSQDIEITSGEGTFIVPAILADSEVIILQAELVSVEGKEIDSHYVLAREPIRKWNSSSDCYIIIEGMEQTMEPGEIALAAILSTCPCDKNFQMVVTTNGQVNYWNERHVETGRWREMEGGSEGRYEEDSVESDAVVRNIEGSAMCRVNFSFTVQTVMAPVSHLLVYYITDEGEPISDVVSFDVNLHQKEVTLEHDEPKELWLVSEEMEVRVSAAEESTLVCLIGGRAASDGKEDESEEREDRPSEDETVRKRFKARIPPRAKVAEAEGGLKGQVKEGTLVPSLDIDADMIPKTANPDMDFEEAGIGYARRRCSSHSAEAMAEVVREAKEREEIRRDAGGDNHPKTKRLQQKLLEGVVRGAGLEQLWVWKCFNYSPDASGGRGLSVRLNAPPDAGKWILRAVALSRRWGVRVSPPLPVSAFRPLATHFRLPASLRVGEALEVDVKIVNNINSCLDITAHLALTEGAHFLSNRVLYLTEKLRLGPHGATSLVVKVVVTRPGLKNMTAEVSGFRSDNCRAAGGNEGAAAASTYGNDTLVVTALRSAAMLVHPEGIVKTTTESAYFCANENVLISSPDTSRFEWVGAPRSREGVVFEVRAGAGVHLALSDVREASSSMYRVALGDADNTVSWIGRGSHAIGVHLSSAQTPKILSSEEFRTFWVTWEQRSGKLEVGLGHVFHNATILSVKADPTLRVRQLGFASDWGQPAEFRVWNFNDEAGFSQVLHLDVPKSVVPGTEQGSLFVAGGLFLPPHRDSTRTSAVTPEEEESDGAMSSWGSSGEEEDGGSSATRAEEDGGEEVGPGVGGDEEWEWEGGPASAGPDLSDAIAAFAPLLRLEHQEAVGEATAIRRQRVRRLLGLRVQVLLGFRNRQEGYFGDHPRVPHYGNTLLAIEVLTKAQAYISVDPQIILFAKRWIHSRQQEDGSFSASPRDGNPVIISRNGTLDRSPDTSRAFNWAVEVTSETVYTLLEINVESEGDSEAIMKARGFLERSLPRVTAPRAVAAMAMALSLSRSPSSPEALEKLRAASTDDEGDFDWTAVPAAQATPEEDGSSSGGRGRGSSNTDWLYEEGEETVEESDPSVSSGAVPGPSVDEFVASLFALRTHTARGDLQSAEPVARFLFYRSQLLDTHRELVYPSARAFFSFATLAADSHRSLTVSLATSGMELTDTIELGPAPPPKSRHRPTPSSRITIRPRAHLLHLPSLPTKVFIYATGAGCASVSGRVTYSTYASPPPTPRQPPLRLWARVESEEDPRPNSIDELQGKLPVVRVRACFRWQGEGASGVLRLEVSLFSGFEVENVASIWGPDGKSIDFLHDKRGERIWFLFDSVRPGCALCARFTARGRFSVRSLRPASARVYPAGRAHLAAHAFFHAPRRTQSALLAGVTDDDLITWFGRQAVDSPDADETPLGSDFSDMCECGAQPCPEEQHGDKKLSTNTHADLKMDNATVSPPLPPITKPPSTVNIDTTTIIHTEQPTTVSESSKVEEVDMAPETSNQETTTGEEIVEVTTMATMKILSRNRNREVERALENSTVSSHTEEPVAESNVATSDSTPTVKEYTTQAILDVESRRQQVSNPTTTSAIHIGSSHEQQLEESVPTTTAVTLKEIAQKIMKMQMVTRSTSAPTQTIPETTTVKIATVSEIVTEPPNVGPETSTTDTVPVVVTQSSTTPTKKSPARPRVLLSPQKQATTPKPDHPKVTEKMLVLNGQSLYGLIQSSAHKELRDRTDGKKGGERRGD